MERLINGLHHVTAIAADPQKNIDFYFGVLGLRLIKKTVNFDAPNVYHLYYGNEQGSPGTIMTFFPYGNIQRGNKGVGQLTTTSFSIGSDSLEFWIKRLNKLKISFTGPEVRRDEEYIRFEDQDGLLLELVANDKDQRKGWSNGFIPENHAIKGFYTVWLNISRIEPTAALLTEYMEYRNVFDELNHFRFEAGDGGPGTYVDLVLQSEAARSTSGAGTIHHVAFSTDNDDTQLKIKEKLQAANLNVTEVMDRQYFHSIYFREPGGILFEVATDPPGFTIDEETAHLGESLKLPHWQEKNRDLIERNLKTITMPVST
ncbi:MAG: ring-cleaving dioxygenase [Bacteroidota bacterium]|jgi:glyoxalase family protein|nr:ring-cleaving dioxygenase [Bacteroidota bacterium]